MINHQAPLDITAMRTVTISRLMLSLEVSGLFAPWTFRPMDTMPHGRGVRNI